MNQRNLKINFEPFSKLDSFQEEGYAWANSMNYFCAGLDVYDTDLVSIAFASIINDYIHSALGYPDFDVEEYLSDKSKDSNITWEKILETRKNIFDCLKFKIGLDVLYRSLEILSEHKHDDTPGVFYNQLSQEQKLKLISFVDSGFGY